MLRKIFLITILYLPVQIALSPSAGVDLASVRVLIIALAAAWLASGLVRKSVRIPVTAEAAFFLSFLFFCMLSLLATENLGWGLRKAAFLLSFAPAFLLASDFGRDLCGKRVIISALILSATVASIIAVLQFSAQVLIGLEPVLESWRRIMPVFLGRSFGQAVLDFPSWLVNIGGRTFFRAVGFFPDPHMLAFFLNLAWPWSLLLAWESRKLGGRKFYAPAGATALILAAALATFSRGAYVGISAGLLFLVILAIFRQPRRETILGTLACLAAAVWISTLGPVRERFVSTFDLREGSNSQRLATWKQAWSVARENWLTGTGLGNYPLAIRPTAGYRDPVYAHNLYLDILAETGVFGLLSWLGLIGLAIADFLRKSVRRAAYLGGALSLIIFSAHAVFETPLYSVHVLPMLLITLSLAQRDEE